MRCSISILILAACSPSPNDTTTTLATGDATTTATTGEPDTTTAEPTSTSSSSTSTSTSTSTPDDATTGMLHGSSSTSTTEDDETTTDTSTTGVVDIPCEELDELACDAQVGCQRVLAWPFDTGVCPDGPTFLACSSDGSCQGPEIIVCRDGTDEVYRAPEDCLQPGFTPCDKDGLESCPACKGLDEATCAAAEKCFAEFGAPHVVQDGEPCADFANKQYLGCFESTGICLPAPDVICPIGQPDMKFTILNQCGVTGFMGLCGPMVENCR